MIEEFGDASTPQGAWLRYQGTSAFTGPTGLYELGWEAAPKTSSPGAGNLLDDLSAELAPLAEIGSDTPSAVAPGPARLPLRLQLAGRLATPGTLKIRLSGAGLDRDRIEVGAPVGIPGARAKIDDRGAITVTVLPGTYGPPGGLGRLTVPVDLSGQSARSVRLWLTAADGDEAAGLPLRTGPAEDCSGTGTTSLRVMLSPEPADLQLTAVSDAVRDGADVAVYTVRNLGPSGASGVTLRAGVPAGVAVAAARSNVGDCLQSGDVSVCHLGQLAPGERASVAVSGRVNSTATSLHNRAVVESVTPDDPALANNGLRLDTPVADNIDPSPAPPAPEPGRPADARSTCT
jgi:hypothetical protein